MKTEIHEISDIRIAEVHSENRLIHNAQDGLDLLGNLYYQGFDRIVVHAHQLSADFFDLKTGLAGEILQKFSNYRVRLAIVGDYSGYSSRSLQDFMRESKRYGHIFFAESLQEALQALART